MISGTPDASSWDPWESRDAEFKPASSMQRSLQQGLLKDNFLLHPKGIKDPLRGSAQTPSASLPNF